MNMWVGNSRSVTATHKDNFENIFVQVRGTKEFILLPSVCMPCMNERSIPQATYVRDGEALALKPDEPPASVPFVTWDPETSEGATPYSHLARPMKVSVHAGDMLYLPAMWYTRPPLQHHAERHANVSQVSQSVIVAFRRLPGQAGDITKLLVCVSHLKCILQEILTNAGMTWSLAGASTR